MFLRLLIHLIERIKIKRVFFKNHFSFGLNTIAGLVLSE
jgi:hypothetical protein